MRGLLIASCLLVAGMAGAAPTRILKLSGNSVEPGGMTVRVSGNTVRAMAKDLSFTAKLNANYHPASPRYQGYQSFKVTHFVDKNALVNEDSPQMLLVKPGTTQRSHDPVFVRFKGPSGGETVRFSLAK